MLRTPVGLILALLLVAPSLAQEIAQPDFSSGSAIMADGYHGMAGDAPVTRIIGQPIYSGTEAGAAVIGNVTDLIVNASGDISAVIVGVGGFLRIGEKAVAVDFADLQLLSGPDGAARYILPTTATILAAAPSFSWDSMPPLPTLDEIPLGDIAMIDNETAVLGTDTAVPMATLNGRALTTADLAGTAVYATGNEQIGVIRDFVLAADGTLLDAVIVDVGGFLGLGSKPVAIGLDGITITTDRNDARYLYLDIGRAQLEAQPAFNRDTYLVERSLQRMVVGQ